MLIANVLILFDLTHTLRKKHRKFWEKTSPRAKIDGIYGYFRNKIPINGSITKPTGDKNKSHIVNGNYCINWEKTGDGRMFYIIQIQLVNSGSSDNGCQNNC